MRYEILLTVEALEDFRPLRARDRSTIRATIERHLRHEPDKVSKSRIKNTVEVFAIVAKSRVAEWLEQEGEKL